MTMPRMINGLAFNGDSDLPLDLRLHSTNTQRPNQGVYKDQNGHLWYVKQGDEPGDIVREAFAGNVFRFLTGPDHSPDTRYLKAEQDHFLISDLTHFRPLEEHKACPELASCLLTSSIINDGDCLPKNIKEVNGKAFRFDFGAASISHENAKGNIPFLLSLKDLQTGFRDSETQVMFESKEFWEFAKKLGEIDLVKFPWEKWFKLAAPHADDYKKWKEDIELKIQLISQYFKPVIQTSGSSVQDLSEAETVLRTNLINFYSILLKHKRESKDDFLINDLPPEELADRHLAYLRLNKEHPVYFINILEEAYKVTDGQSNLRITPYHQYATQTFRAEEFGIERTKSQYSFFNFNDIMSQLSALSVAVKKPNAEAKLQSQLDRFADSAEEEKRNPRVYLKKLEALTKIMDAIDTHRTSPGIVNLQSVLSSLRDYSKQLRGDTSSFAKEVNILEEMLTTTLKAGKKETEKEDKTPDQDLGAEPNKDKDFKFRR